MNAPGSLARQRIRWPVAAVLLVVGGIVAGGVASGGVRAAAEEVKRREAAVSVDPGSIDVKERYLEKIPPGTEIGKTAPKGWTHLVFVATPTIAEGDVEALPSMAKSIASMLQLTVLANARNESDDPGGNGNGGSRSGGNGASGKGPWRLEKVAVGFATPVNGKRIVISSDSERRLGANLDFIERMVLSGQERYLAEERGVLQVVTAPNMVVFDARSVMLIKERHREMIVRHAVVIDPSSGGMGALVWLIDPQSKGYQLAEDAMQLLPSNFQEKRRMHVDASQITLGIPGPTALAVVSIPKGVEIPFSPALREVAALRRFTPEAAAELEAEIWKALAAAGVK